MSTKRRALTLALLIGTATMSMAATAMAVPGRDAGGADVLFREGRKAMHAGNYDVACPKFQESYRLDPAPGTLLNLGDCEEKRGHLVTAWQFFREAEQRLGQDERSAIAKQRWEALEGRLAFVTFRLPPGAPSDVTVLRDDVELKAASLGVALPLDPGKHVVRVRTSATAETKIEITLKSGERRDVMLDLGAAAPVSPRPSPSDAGGGRVQESNHEGASPLPYVAFGVAAVGLIALGVGTWQVLDAKSTVEKQCTNGQCEQAGLDAAANGKTFSAVATVGGIVAVAGAAAGAVLLLTTPRKTTAFGAGPMVGGFGFSASHSF